MNSLIADGTFPPRLVIKGQVMQHTRPAVDVTAASDLGCQYTTAHCHAHYNRLTSGAVTGLCYSLFTLTTPTRQNCLVWSCLCRQCEHNCRQYNTVLCCLDPLSNLQLFSHKYIEDYWRLGKWVKTRQNCLVLSAVVFTPPTQTRQDSIVLSCLCRRCEPAINTMQITEQPFATFVLQQ